MNHMLSPLERLVMDSQKERDETENNRGVDWRQLSFPILVVTANPAWSTHWDAFKSLCMLGEDIFLGYEHSNIYRRCSTNL